MGMSKDKMFSMISLGFMNHASYAKRLKMGEIPGVSHKDHADFLGFFDKQINQMQMMKQRSDMMLKQMEAKIAMEPHLAELHKDHIMKAKIENKALYHSAGQTNAQKFYLEMLLTKKHKELKPTFKEYMAASSKIDRFNRKDQGATLKKFFLEGEDSVTNEEFLEPWKVVAAGIKNSKEARPILPIAPVTAPGHPGPSGHPSPYQPPVQPQSSSSMYLIAALVLALLAAVAFAYKQRQASQTEEEEDDIENPKPKTKKTKSRKSKSGEKSDSGKESSSSDVKKTKKSKKTKTTDQSDSSSEETKEKKTKKSKDSKKSKDKKKSKKKTKTAKKVDSDSEL